MRVSDGTHTTDGDLVIGVTDVAREVTAGSLGDDVFKAGKSNDALGGGLGYDKAKGVLWYDADASGKGKAVEVATLTKGLEMSAAEFFVI